MAVLSQMAERLRFELGDQAKSFVWEAVANGLTNRFLVPYSPINGATLVVEVNGMDESQSVEVEELTGYIIFDDIPEDGDIIRVSGTYYRFFSDAEIENFVCTAFGEHSANRADAFGRIPTLMNLPGVEEYPVVIYAASLALYTLATDASFDINVFAPDGVTIPRSERFQQLMQMSQARREQYKEMCSLLGIGLFKVDVFSLRRISKTTNRYVPVFLPKEVDDRSQPQRANLAMPTYGSAISPSSVQVYDLTMYQGDSFSIVLDFPFDLTGYTFLAQIRLSPGSPTLLGTFTVEQLPDNPDKIQLSLTSTETERLPDRCFWDFQVTSPEDPSYQQTYMRGTIFVTRQVSV